MNPGILTADAPTRWVLVFQRTSPVRWLRWLVPGRYKHVAAYAYLVNLKAWLIFDVNLKGVSLIVVPDGDEALGWLADLTRDSDLVAMKASARAVLPLFGWCVPAIKHLVGLRSGALFPCGLYRDCLRAGGEPLHEHRDAEICSARA